MPSGQGIISDSLIYEISNSVQAPIDTFLLILEREAKSIIDHHDRTRTTTIQIVNHIDSVHHDKIRVALPEVKIVQVVHVVKDESISYAREISKFY
jgi:phosphoribosylanthranilate isomerase